MSTLVRMNSFILFLFLCLVPNVFAQAPVISPATAPVVLAGASTVFACSSGGPCTWTCVGCAGSIVAGTGVYTAPATIASNQSLGGYQLLPNDHIFNTRIDSLSVNASSATWIAGAGSHAVTYEPSFPMNYRNGTTPTAAETCFFDPGQNGTYQIDAYPFGRVESGWFITRVVSGGGDGSIDVHITGIDSTSGQVQELYDLDGRPGHMTSCANYTNSQYAIPNGQGATDAAGMYLLPLTLRLQEVENAIAGNCPTVQSACIKHALRMTLQNGFIANSHIWPATTNSSSGGGVVPDGARFRLKASYDLSTFGPIPKILLTQLQQYGLILSDGGTGWGVQTEYAKWPPEIIDAFFTITGSGLTASSFEAVDESGLMLSASSGATTSSETVTATAVGGTATRQVVLTGVTLTLPKDNINIQTASAAQQLADFIQGSANTAVTWSMNPSIGTLTAGGLYTPPATNQIWTIEAQSNATSTFMRAIEDLNVSSTGTYPSYATIKKAGEWIHYMVALKSNGSTPYGAHPVQSTSGQDIPQTCTSCDDGFATSATTGNLAVIAVYENTDSTATISSATMDCGTLAADANSPKRGATSSMWIFTGQVTNGTCHTGSVHIIFNHSVTVWMYQTEYHNMAAANPVDCSAAGTGTGQVLSSGTCATANAADTLFAYSGVKTAGVQLIWAGGTTMYVTATSSADPTVSAVMKINFFPTGTMRLVLGWAQDYIDVSGNVWQAQIGDDGCLPDNTNGLGGFPVVTDVSLYKVPCYPTNDLRFDFYVPNGTYTIVGKYSEVYNVGVNNRLMNLEGEGITNYAGVDIQTASGGVKKVIDYSSQAVVTTGLLSFVLRHLGGVAGQGGAAPEISALQITRTGMAVGVALTPKATVTSGMTVR